MESIRLRLVCHLVCMTGSRPQRPRIDMHKPNVRRKEDDPPRRMPSSKPGSPRLLLLEPSPIGTLSGKLVTKVKSVFATWPRPSVTGTEAGRQI